MKNPRSLRNTYQWLILLSLIIVLLASCNGTNESGISMEDLERIVAETSQALTAESVDPPTATLVPASTPLPPTFTPTPTIPSSLPAAVRIHFAAGSTSGDVSGTLGAGEVKHFVLGAQKGQPMLASVYSRNNDVTMAITTAAGIQLLPSDQGSANWQGP